MQNKIKIIFVLFVLMCGFGYSGKSAERWIDYDVLSKITIGLSQKDVETTLGEPLLVLGDNDGEENVVYLYYNYHVKSYLSKDGPRDSINERSTLIKFTFENDTLSSWEEDNLTLGMIHNKNPRSSYVFNYVNLLINIILLGAVFGGY